MKFLNHQKWQQRFGWKSLNSFTFDLETTGLGTNKEKDFGPKSYRLKKVSHSTSTQTKGAPINEKLVEDMETANRS